MEFQLTYPTLLEQVTLNYCKHELCQQETSEIFRIYLYLQTYEIIMKKLKDTINATGIIFFHFSLYFSLSLRRQWESSKNKILQL